MLRSPRLGTTTPAGIVAALLLAIALFACATTHEEPPAPPPPPVDPATFSGPARAPAPQVDLRADLDGGDLWADSGSSGYVAPGAADAASDAQSAAAIPKKSDAQPAAAPKGKR